MKRMRSILSVVLVFMMVALSFGLSGCFFNQEQGTGLTLSDPAVTTPTIATPGVLRIGVDSSHGPFAGIVDGKVVGIDRDIAAAVAERLGLRLELIDIANQDPTQMLAEGTVDIVMGVKKSNEVSPQNGLIGPYIVDGPAIFVINQSGVPQPLDPATLNGQTIVTKADTRAAWQAQQAYGSENVIELELAPNEIAPIFNQLKSGEVTYAAVDAVSGSHIAAVNYDDIVCAAFLADKDGVYPEGVYMAVRPDNTELANKVTQALQGMRDGGELTVIVSKWLGPVSTSVLTGKQAIESHTVTPELGGATGGGTDTGADPNAAPNSLQ